MGATKTLVLESLPVRRESLPVAMLLSWGVLMVIVSKGWESAFLDSMRRLNDTLEGTQGRGSRVVLLGVVALFLARFVLTVVALYVALTFVCALAMYAAAYVSNTNRVVQWWRRGALAGPAAWLYWMHPHHLPVHAAILLAALLLGMLQALLYVRDDDLSDATAVRSKAARILMGIATLSLASYVVYALLALAFRMGKEVAE